MKKIATALLTLALALGFAAPMTASAATSYSDGVSASSGEMVKVANKKSKKAKKSKKSKKMKKRTHR